MINSPFEYPKCNMMYDGVITKYLPFKEVPVYAEFQPVQKLSYCKGCGFYGAHKVEMLERDSFLYMNFSTDDIWTEKELQEFKIN